MCGITGAVGTAADPAAVAAMTAAVRHRGPDAAGFRDFPRCSLGHRRLRVVDLSPAGDQPMPEEAGVAWLVYNGEVYNFGELRAELVAAGHRFRSATDTEVLVHLYEQHGDALVHRLRGMFAFAIWDEPAGRLLLARDRLGIKPLYYRESAGGLRFSSEVRALREPGDALDPAAVAGALRLGWVPGPGTIVAGIRELPPGHLLTWQDGGSQVTRWWAPPPVGEADGVPLRDVLADAVARHLVADVPTGVFLSAGADSVAVTRLAAEVGADVRAYTVAFDTGPDESAEAAAIARRIGVAHRVVPARGGDVTAKLPEVLDALDQPTVDGVNSWLVSGAVREAGVVVALSGLGGDELFGGYSTFRHVPRLSAAGRTASGLGLGAVTHAAARRLPAAGRTRALRAAEAVVTGGEAAAYAAVRGPLSWASLARLWPDVGRVVPGRDRDLVRPAPPGLSGVSGQELGNYLPYQLLRDTDATSMAFGLEVRVPLLDDAVVAWALRHGAAAGGKRALLAAAAPEFADIAGQPKRTFTLPFAAWLRGPLAEPAHSGLLALERTGLGFDRSALLDLWSAYQAGRGEWRALWAAASLGLWLDGRGWA